MTRVGHYLKRRFWRRFPVHGQGPPLPCWRLWCLHGYGPRQANPARACTSYRRKAGTRTATIGIPTGGVIAGYGMGGAWLAVPTLGRDCAPTALAPAQPPTGSRNTLRGVPGISISAGLGMGADAFGGGLPAPRGLLQVLTLRPQWVYYPRSDKTHKFIYVISFCFVQ